jgi:hypothetical protein
MANPKAETAVAGVGKMLIDAREFCYRKLNVNVCRNSNPL